MRFPHRLSIGQQLGLPLTLCALPLVYLGYCFGLAGSYGAAVAITAGGLLAASGLSVVIAKQATANSERVIASSRRVARGEFAIVTADDPDPVGAAPGPTAEPAAATREPGSSPAAAPLRASAGAGSTDDWTEF